MQKNQANTNEEMLRSGNYWTLARKLCIPAILIMLVMVLCNIATYLLRNMDKRVVMAVIILGGIISGYDDRIGDTLALSRFFVYYPFYYAGYICRGQGDNAMQALRRPAARLISALAIAGYAFICFFG